jgi:hypothetical protein
VPEVIAGLVAVVALVLFRHYAARQVAARRGRFVWAFAFPMLLGPAVMVRAGLRLLSTGPIVGGLMILFGLAVGAVELRFLRRASRAVSTASPADDLDGALIEPTADFLLVITVGGLLFAILGGLALVALAIAAQRH